MPLADSFVNLLLFALLAFGISGSGMLVASALKLRFATSLERLLFAAGLGAGTTGYLVFALGSLQLLTSPFLWGVCAILLITGSAGWLRRPEAGITDQSLLPSHPLETISAIVVVAVVGALFLLALTPEAGKDALVYHLGVPKLYLKHGGFFFIDGNVAQCNPFLNEMLFLLALFLKGDILAKLLVFGVLLLLVAGVRVISSFAGSRFPWLAAAIFTTIPTVFIVAGAAYVELFSALYVLLAFLSMMRWKESGENGWLVACGIFIGFALSTKFTAILLPALAFLAILLVIQKREETGPRLLSRIAILGVTIALTGSPFYIRNIIMTGNPVYPFMYGFFGGLGWSEQQAHLYDGVIRYYGMGRSPLDYLLLPWNVSLHGELGTRRFDGIIGPIFLVMVPLALWKPDEKVKWMLAYCGGAFLFWATTSQQIRFLTPMLLFLSVIAGYVVSRQKRTVGVTVIAIVTAGCIAMNVPYLWHKYREVAPLEYLSGRETRTAFLDRMISPYRVYRYLDEKLAPDSKTFLVYMRNLTFLTDRDVFSDYMFESFTLQQIISGASGAEDVRRALLKRGFTHMAYSEPFVSGDKSVLTPAEIELFKKFRDSFLTPVYSHGTYRLARITAP